MGEGWVTVCVFEAQHEHAAPPPADAPPAASSPAASICLQGYLAHKKQPYRDTSLISLQGYLTGVPAVQGRRLSGV